MQLEREISKHFGMIEQKCMTFDHDFGYSFPFISSLLKKGRKKKNELQKSLSKVMPFCSIFGMCVLAYMLCSINCVQMFTMNCAVFRIYNDASLFVMYSVYSIHNTI